MKRNSKYRGRFLQLGSRVFPDGTIRIQVTGTIPVSNPVHQGYLNKAKIKVRKVVPSAVVSMDYTAPILMKNGEYKRTKNGSILYPKAVGKDEEVMNRAYDYLLNFEESVKSGQYVKSLVEKQKIRLGEVDTKEIKEPLEHIRYIIESEKKGNYSYKGMLHNLKKFIPIYFKLSNIPHNSKLEYKHLNYRFAKEFQKFLLSLVSDTHSTYSKRKGELKHNTAITYIRRFVFIMQELELEGVLQESPIKGLKIEAERTKPSKPYLTREQYNKLRLVESSISREVVVAFRFAIHTGLRFSDIRTLKWSEVDLSDNSITYEVTKSRKKKKVTTYLTAEAVNLLKEQKLKNMGFVFQMPSNCWTNVELMNWGKAAEIDIKMNFHLARHTAATWMYEATGDIFAVQRLLGHESINMAQTYVKVDKKKDKQNISAFAAFMERTA